MWVIYQTWLCAMLWTTGLQRKIETKSRCFSYAFQSDADNFKIIHMARIQSPWTL